MTNEDFLALRPGDSIELPMDQVRVIDHAPNPANKPWNQVATVTESWFDALSGSHTFFVDASDVVSRSSEDIHR